MHNTSFSKIEDFRDEFMSPSDELKIIDICGLTKDVSCEFIFSEENWSYEQVTVNRYGNFKKGIGAESVDVVVIGQTLERVNYFWVLLDEISTILKPDGLLCAIVSSSGAFSSRGDFYRFHPDSLIALAELIDLDALKCEVDVMNIWRDATIIARKRNES